jgi:hypothetical protein
MDDRFGNGARLSARGGLSATGVPGDTFTLRPSNACAVADVSG